MGDSDRSLLKAVKHYQECLDKYTESRNDAKLIHCLDKLQKLPIKVSHLEQTGVGRTVNGLRKFGGQVGESAKSLVTKWKDMVVGEHEEEDDDDDDDDEDEDDQEDGYESGDPDSSVEEKEEDHTKRGVVETDSSSHRHSDNHRTDDERHRSKKSKYSSSQLDSEKHSSKKEKDHHQNGHSSSKHKSHKRKTDEDSDEERHYKRRKKESSDEEDAEKYKHKKRNDSDTEEYSAKSKEKKQKSRNDPETPKKDKQHKSSEKAKKAHDSSSDFEDSCKSYKNKESHRSSSSSREKKDKHKNESSREKSSASSSSSSKKVKHEHSRKTKEGEPKKDKEKEKRSSSSSNSKSKDRESSRSKEQKEEKSSSKSKSVPISKSGIDSGSGASFAEALGMCEPSSSSKNSQKKKEKEKEKPTAVSFEKEKKDNKPSKSDDTVPKLLKEPVQDPFDLNISSLLPPITPNYRPLGNSLLGDSQPKKVLSDYEQLSNAITSKNQRTKVYSGNKTGYGKVPTLFESCIRVLQDNIDALEYTGGVPFIVLKPILEKSTPNQLFTMEHHNPYLIEDTDELWQVHCQKAFRNKKREELETWREMYMRCSDEREAKLKALTANIKQAQDKSLPVRTTKLAYVDDVVKPPRNIARKQMKNGTAFDKKPALTPSARLSSLATSGEAGKVAVPNPGARAVERSSSQIVKPKKAPLMAKSLSLLKNRFRR